LLYGHVLDLKERVDYIFLPYIISTKEGTYFCPKLIGSPDIIKANIEDVRLLSFDVDMDNYYSSLLSSLKEVARKLSMNPLKVYSAFKQAKSYQEKFNKRISKGMLFDEAIKTIEDPSAGITYKPPLYQHKQFSKDNNLCIAVIGHNYVFYDKYVSFDMIKKLMERGIEVVTSDRLSDMQIDNSLKYVEKRPHWSIGSRVLGSAIHYSMLESVDGIIYITPFGCSSDSLIKEYIDANIQKMKPFMTVTVDEHSADAGIITRLEAFIDMLERREKKALKNKLIQK
jgi:predicted nucleotide-binding protein (sugar kinase/HSP70/actin superfamily)